MNFQLLFPYLDIHCKTSTIPNPKFILVSPITQNSSETSAAKHLAYHL